MSGPSIVPLSEVAALQSGGTPSKANSNYWSGTIPWLTPKDMADFNGTTQENVTDEAIGNGTRLAPASAVFIAVRGMSLHKEIRVVKPGRRMSFNQDIKAVIPKNIDRNFLYYALVANKPNLLGVIESAGHGTGVLPTDRLENIQITRLGATEETAIGAFFCSLDDKIDLNRRMNETLEATARAIFKDWFVDFGPTRAKMEGRAPYLAPEIWKTFPDRLDDEGKPEGWSIQELATVTSELRRGISPSYLESGGICVLNQKCIRNRQVNQSLARRHDTSKRAVSGRELETGDVLVNSTGVGTLGRAAQIWALKESAVADSHVTVVRANGSQISSLYLGLDLTGRERELEALGEGSTGQTELSRSRLSAMPVLLPCNKVQKAFDKFVEPLVQRITSNQIETVTLAATRDLLLPKLISGEIRVKDAEKIAEAAL
jgi:type I restriction enzyme S subunit